MTGPTGEFMEPYKVDLMSHPIFRAISEARQRGEDFHVFDLGGQGLAETYKLLESFVNKKEFQKFLELGFQVPSRQINHYVFGAQVSLLFITYDPVPEAHDIFKRFGKVFEQTYTRFLDLQKAEAQAREAQIEAALERVRSRSMGMQKSEELKEVIQVVYEQFVHLNIHVEHTGFIMDYKTRDDMHIWLADKHEVPSQVTIPYFDCAHWNSFNEAKEKGMDFFANHLTFEEKNKFYQDLFKLFPVPEEAKEYYFSCPGLAGSTVLLENVGLYIENFSGIPYSDEENNTLMRFGKVFQQTYTRFLDLQKAEAQARESQIQLALERVRARTMAMYDSSELSEAAALLFDQVKQLGAELWAVGFAVCEKDNLIVKKWTSIGSSIGQLFDPIFIPYNADHGEQRMYDAWKNQIDLFEEVQEGDELRKIYEHFMEIPSVKVTLQKTIDSGISLPVWQKNHVASYKYGYLLIITTKPFEETQIFKRFAKVFEQTYTRFLDLQKAEAQAREAQIELGLERVRARAMAMQKSDDLARAVAIIFEELDKLNIGILRCGIGILNKENRSVNVWTTSKSDENTPVQISGDESMDSHPLLQGAFNAWLKQEEYSYVLHGKDLTDYYKAQAAANFKLPDSQSLITANEDLYQYYFLATFQAGGLFAFRETPFPDEAKKVMKRFAGVFNLTYKRFIDLQKAEAQARESQIQLALERVRARTMAMQNSDELPEAANLLFQQVQLLGMSAWSAGYCIWDEDKKAITLWMSSEGVIQPALRMPLTEDPYLMHFREGDERDDSFWVEAVGGEELKKHYAYLRTLPGLKESLDDIEAAGFPVPTFQIFHFAYFSKGFLLFITYEPVPEAHDIFKRFGKVFEQTYTRFLDLQKAEAQARESQIQLALERVRARTMAMQKSDELG